MTASPFNLDMITLEDIMGNLQTQLDAYEQKDRLDPHNDHLEGIIYGFAEAMSTIRSLILLRGVINKDNANPGHVTYLNLDRITIDIRLADGRLVPAVITDRGMFLDGSAIDITVEQRTDTPS